MQQPHLQRVTPNGHPPPTQTPPLSKVFDRPFFKKRPSTIRTPPLESFYVAFFKKRPPIQGRAALGRARRRETSLTAFQFAQRITGSFLCAYLLKERTRTVFSHFTPRNHHIEKALSVLFLGYVAARKRTKKNGDERVSLVATSDEGFTPSTCASL